jgi:hypothetical protein
MMDETYGGAFYPPNKEPLIIRCNGLTKTDELDALQKTLQKQAGDKPVILLPYYCDIVIPSVQPLVLTCDGCRHVGTYDTDFPCSSCIRREKDYYEQER